MPKGRVSAAVNTAKEWRHDSRDWDSWHCGLLVDSLAVVEAARMSLNRYATRRDAVEPAIVDALEKVGAHVWYLDYPVDLLVRFRETWHLLEVKTGKAKPRCNQTAQRNFIEFTQTPIVRTPMEALRAIGACT